MASLIFNNTRSNNVFVRMGINNQSLGNTAYPCPKKATTTIDLEVDDFTQLIVRVQANNGTGNGKGDLECRTDTGVKASSAECLLARSADNNVKHNAVLVLFNSGGQDLDVNFELIESTA